MRRTFVALLLPILGCNSHDGVGSSPGAIKTDLHYEGSCEHLACCSGGARHTSQDPGTFDCAKYNAGGAIPQANCNAPKPGYFAPKFACAPHRDDVGCKDSDAWLAMPGAIECGKKVWVCRKGRAVEATIKDASDKRQLWEGSPGLYTGLGVGWKTHEKYGIPWPKEDPFPISIYDQQDAAAEKDPECGCGCGPLCFSRIACRGCDPQGSCTSQSGSPPGSATVCWANGVKSVVQGMATTVTKNGEPCHSAETSFESGLVVILFRDPAGQEAGKAYVNIFDTRSIEIECGGKRHKVDLTQPACKAVFEQFTNPPKCAQGTC